jgi:hypothetical protein
MSALDYAKALGVAVLLMALNVGAAFAVMAVYGDVLEPGRDPAFYQEAAQRIAPWSSVVVGVVLFFGAGWLFVRRRPQRSALGFALTFALIYVALDLAILLAADAAGARSMAGLIAASMLSKLAAALGGAALARRG